MAQSAPPEIEAQAAPYLERCDQGDAYACEYAIALIKRNDRTFWQSDRYIALSLQACEVGSSRSCWNFEWQGYGGVLNPIRQQAEVYLPTALRGCENGSGVACWQAGDLLTELGQAGPAEILGHYDRSCEIGYSDGCAAAADLRVEQGLDAVPTSLRACYGTAVGQAPKLASCQRGCESGDALSCYRAGLILERGRDGINPVRANAQQSEALFRQACAGGHAAACR